MKSSTMYWMRSIGWTLLALAFLALALYGLTGSFKQAFFILLALMLFGVTANKGQNLAVVARMLDMRDTMSDVEQEPIKGKKQ